MKKIIKIVITLIGLICFFNSSLDIYASETQKTKTEGKYEQIEGDDIELEMYYDSLELLAICVEAEAGNQGLLGKRLVVDVILNRVDSDIFPDDIVSVITQENQFSTYTDGGMEKVIDPSEETYEAVRMELEQRISYKIVFFSSEGYSKYGIDAFKYKDHYFSYLKEGNENE